MKLDHAQAEELLRLLQRRFARHMQRHTDISWSSFAAKLQAQPDKLWSIAEMERTGGEPDVVGYDSESGAYLVYDCAEESPAGRRSLCYDRTALMARRVAPPSGSALEMAEVMGIELLTEAEYRALQELGRFDTRTSSWLKTPDAIRSLGGALFGDRRYDQVFVYHNGASSYYGARGFRGALRV
jgi:hypothetical protein